MKKEKLTHYANLIASHADAAWVPLVFFFIFFLDSFLVFIPSDSLLGTSVAIRPQRVKVWVGASVLGIVCGLGLVVLASYTFLQGSLPILIEKGGFSAQVDQILQHAQQYGYVELVLSVFTVLPSIVGAIIGALLGMNPWAIFLIVVSAKVLRALLAVWVLHAGGTLLKRLIRIYLKIPT